MRNSISRALPRNLPLFALGLFFFSSAIAQDADPSADSLAELKAREAKVREVVRKVRPATVAITNYSINGKTGGTGSGVIIDKSGLIMTAAHVTDATGDELTITFQDGTQKRGKALGRARSIDAGLAIITEEGDWPVAEMGESDFIERGKWCVALGHPGGFDAKRPSPVRVGRVWQFDRRGAMFTDCTLIGGDSGGPLLDLDGRVIGIHSSIGPSVAANRHIPIDGFREYWDRMKKGGDDGSWGELRLQGTADDRPTLGIRLDLYSKDGVLVEKVFDNMPAAEAGIKEGDKITHFNGHDVLAYPTLYRKISGAKLGKEARVVVRRGDEDVELKVTPLSHKELQITQNESRRRRSRPKPAPNPEPHPEEEPAPPEPGSGYLGVEISQTDDGVRIDHVFPGSPAETAGLKVGDIMKNLQEKDVESEEQLIDLMAPMKSGDPLKLKIERGGEEREIELELGDLK